MQQLSVVWGPAGGCALGDGLVAQVPAISRLSPCLPLRGPSQLTVPSPSLRPKGQRKRRRLPNTRQENLLCALTFISFFFFPFLFFLFHSHFLSLFSYS